MSQGTRVMFLTSFVDGVESGRVLFVVGCSSEVGCEVRVGGCGVGGCEGGVEPFWF